MGMETGSVNGGSKRVICITWGVGGRSEIRKAQKKFGRSCEIVPGAALHPKGTARLDNSLYQKKINSRKPDRLLKKAIKNFEKALKSAKKEAARKEVTLESMKATLAKHAINQHEVKDIFDNMPPTLRGKKAVSQAFEQMLAANKPIPMSSPAPLPPAPDYSREEPIVMTTFGKTTADHQPKKPVSTFGKITPNRTAPDAFIAELRKQKQDEFAMTDDIDQLRDYMIQLKQHNAPEKLLLELAKSFPDYQAAGWDVDQFMEFCYEAQLAMNEGYADNPASAMDEAYRKMGGK